MDAEETPPTKRIKSEEAYVEPGMAYEAATGENGVKLEQEVLASTSEAGLPLSDAVKLEPTLAESTSASPTTEAPPPVKKKKSSSASKPSSSKPKKTSKKTSAPSADTTRKPKPSPSPTPPPPVLDEDEDQALYCTCQRRQDDVEGGMIMCDRCDGWYHYRCMRITEVDAELVDQFICPPCHAVTGEETTYKTGCARESCRRAAAGPFSKFCSQRCGVLMVSERMGALGVRGREREAVDLWGKDARVAVARRTEGLTQRNGETEAAWEKVVGDKLSVGATSSSIQRLGLAGAFNLMVKCASAPTSASTVTSNGAANGTPAQPSSAAISAHTKPTSSATSLLAITEQLALVSHQILSVDLAKSALDARLDRLDSRSTLLHLASDRVPTLPPISSTTDTPADDDEVDAKPKKKKGSKSKSSSTDAGPRCGYDHRLHWDDTTFDAWARTPTGSAILSHEQPLDGELDDGICALAKRKCRRHLDWSNLCELALDAEKAGLSVESRSLTGLKLRLVEQRESLEREREVVRELAEVEERRERRRREERDRDVAMRMANEGTRRG